MRSRSDCPVSFALDLFGDTWSLLVIRDMVFEGKRRYNDFLTSEEGIATNILSNRLLSLEHAGIIKKIPDVQHPKKSVYLLTDAGINLLPILVELVLWSTEYDPQECPPDAFVRSAKRDKTGLIRKMKADIKKRQRLYMRG